VLPLWVVWQSDRTLGRKLWLEGRAPFVKLFGLAQGRQCWVRV
jgi:hypothetical protein